MGLFSFKKSQKSGWTCKECDQDLSIKDVGLVVKDGKKIINNSSGDGFEKFLTQKDDMVLCKKCTLNAFISMICHNAEKEKRPLKIDELRTIVLYHRSDSLQEYSLNKEVKNREILPENSARWEAMLFDAEGKTSVDFICPKCSKETRIVIQDASINSIKEQINFFNHMYEKIPMTCPSCANNFTLWK